MSFLSEYKASLKAVEAEEIFDLIIYRPLAFVFVKLTFPFNLTPDRVSIIALILGCSAGVAFAFGHLDTLIAGAILYFISNVLDCADGQIARLKKNGTKLGRIIDGLVDYLVSIFVFTGIAIGLTIRISQNEIILWGNLLNWHPLTYIWTLSLLAGLSSALQALLFDFYRNKFLEVVFGRVTNIMDEIKEYENEKIKIITGEKKANVFEKFLINIYLKYTHLQLRIQKDHEKTTSLKKIPSEIYYKKNRLILRLWSWIGSTTHITICIICALIGNMEAFLIICVLPFNLVMIILFFIQKFINNGLERT